MKTILRLFYLIILLLILLGGGYILLMMADGNLDTLTITNVAQLNPDATAIPVTVRPVTPETDPDNATFEALLDQMNGLRIRRGLPTVRYDNRLHRAAAVQVAYTASLPNGRLTHTGPDGSEVADRVEDEGYRWSTVAENLLFNYSLNGVAAYRQWRNSPPHFDNMIHPDVTEIGVAYTVTPIGQVYYALVLAEPR